MNSRDYFDLIAELANYDRTHNSAGMASAITHLISFYPGSQIIKTSAEKQLSNYWKIPPRYNLKKAYIKANGKKILDNSDHLLAVNAFSHPIHTKLSFDELKKKILYDKDRPNDYIFSFRFQYRFWENNWAFHYLIKRYVNSMRTQNTKCLLTQNLKLGLEMKCCRQNSSREVKKEEILFVGHFDHLAK